MNLLLSLGKWLFFVGLGILILGLILWLMSKIGIPFGKLPGDILIKKEKYSIFMPIVTCIFLSVFLTIIVNLAIWLITNFKK